ncbi:hypothetical protein HS3_02508 [Bacillus subtilis]|nr:hypothetical protein HS3_02508 [Bacillus subtilis]
MLDNTQEQVAKALSETGTKDINKQRASFKDALLSYDCHYL